MKKLIAIATLFTLLGAMYLSNSSNEEIIASDDDSVVARRLDDHGDNSKRSVASSARNLFHKADKSGLAIIKKSPVFTAKVASTSEKLEVAKQEIQAESAFKDVQELSLPLTEAYGRDTKKFPNGISTSEISGRIELKDGNIESLDVTIKGETIAVNYSELKGNSFSYKMEGDDCYGALIPTPDKRVYMVELTGGPLDKTRLMFGKSKNTQTQAAAAPVKEESKAVKNNDDRPLLHEVQDDIDLRAEMQLPEENAGA